jgi:serine/threonine protein kinase
MPLSVGTRIGAYEVIGALGAGGMGEAYRARDTRLGRDVALKILPGALATDPDRLVRFEREARTLASLNHPHIAQLHGVEDAGGTPALVMEFVDGENLSWRIARGPLPLDEALPIARQIAEALEAAHELGIVHRDLKPANIKVRDDGTVKVLDFGLAKALDPAGSSGSFDLANSPTITSPALTMHGVILGTAAYMAPEQAKGKPVDKRADIWAFGCVLYEMLTGERGFKGEDTTDTIAAVVSKEPDWTRLPATTPPGISRLLRRCLVKDRRNRLPDIAAARLDIDDAQEHPGRSETVAPASFGRRGRLLLSMAVAGALGLVAGLWFAPAPAPPATAPVIRFAVTPSDLDTSGQSTRIAGRSSSRTGSDSCSSPGAAAPTGVPPTLGSSTVALPCA